MSRGRRGWPEWHCRSNCSWSPTPRRECGALFSPGNKDDSTNMRPLRRGAACCNFASPRHFTTCSCGDDFDGYSACSDPLVAAVAVALLALMVTAVRRRILRARRRPRQQGDRKIWPKRWGKSANCPRTLRSSGCNVLVSTQFGIQGMAGWCCATRCSRCGRMFATVSGMPFWVAMC